MTDQDRPPLYTPSELPPVATGLTRGFHRAAHAVVCAALPAFVRHRFGWWTWKEVMAPNPTWSNRYEPRQDPRHPDFEKNKPVSRLVRWGIPFPADATPWPSCFKKYSTTSNWDTVWDWLPPQELTAWVHVWSHHPQGQYGLDAALTGLAGVGNAGAVALLLKQGANPSAQDPSRFRTAMENLWCAEDPNRQRNALPMDKLLATWSAFLDHGAKLDWSALEQGAYRARSLDEYRSILDAGLPLPPASVLNAWGAAVVNDPSFGWDDKRDVGLLEFLMDRCPALKAPERRGELLAICLCTARNGDDEKTHESMRRWLAVLAPDGQLPPLPTQEDPVPRQPSRADYFPPNYASWGHVFTQAPFLENFPSDLVLWLCSSDPTFQAVDADGLTVLDRIADRVARGHSQSRDVGLGRLGAWVRSLQLDRTLPPVEDPSPTRRAPRF